MCQRRARSHRLVMPSPRRVATVVRGKHQRKQGCCLANEAAALRRIKTFGRLRRAESLRERRGSSVLLHALGLDPGQRYLFGPSAGMATEGLDPWQLSAACSSTVLTNSIDTFPRRSLRNSDGSFPGAARPAPADGVAAGERDAIRTVPRCINGSASAVGLTSAVGSSESRRLESSAWPVVSASVRRRPCVGFSGSIPRIGDWARSIEPAAGPADQR